MASGAAGAAATATAVAILVVVLVLAAVVLMQLLWMVGVAVLMPVLQLLPVLLLLVVLVMVVGVVLLVVMLVVVLLIEIFKASNTLTTMCGFTGTETELDLSKKRLSASYAMLVANQIKVNRALTSLNMLCNNFGTDQANTLIEILEGSDKLTTMCGFTGAETELDLTEKGLNAGCAVLVANEIKVNTTLTSLKVNEYAIPVKDVKTNKTLDLSHKNFEVKDAIIFAALLSLNE